VTLLLNDLSRKKKTILGQCDEGEKSCGTRLDGAHISLRRALGHEREPREVTVHRSGHRPGKVQSWKNRGGEKEGDKGWFAGGTWLKSP